MRWRELRRSGDHRISVGACERAVGRVNPDRHHRGRIGPLGKRVPTQSIGHLQYSALPLLRSCFLPKDCLLGLYVPNAFSPDNNGKNDVFKPLLFGNIVQYEFSVYNRFGQVVFRSSKPAEGWDGYYKNTPQPAGAYLWTCSYQLDNQPLKFTKGTVMIIQ